MSDMTAIITSWDIKYTYLTIKRVRLKNLQ